MRNTVVFIRMVDSGVEYLLPCSSEIVANALKNDLIDEFYRNRKARVTTDGR